MIYCMSFSTESPWLKIRIEILMKHNNHKNTTAQDTKRRRQEFNKNSAEGYFATAKNNFLCLLHFFLIYFLRVEILTENTCENRISLCPRYNENKIMVSK